MPSLIIHIDSENYPLPRWWIRAVEGRPELIVSLPMELRNFSSASIELVAADLDGIAHGEFANTLPLAAFSEGFHFVGSRLYPVTAKPGEKLCGRLALFDRQDISYDAGDVAFEPSSSINTQGAAEPCALCGHSTAQGERIALFCTGVAHQHCIWH